MTQIFSTEPKRSDCFQKLVSVSLMASHFGKCTMADSIIDSVLAFSPDNASILVLKGLTYIYSDRLQMAVDFLQKSVLAVYPDNQEAQNALGLAYKMMGLESQAQAALQNNLRPGTQEHIRDYAQEILNLPVGS